MKPLMNTNQHEPLREGILKKLPIIYKKSSYKSLVSIRVYSWLKCLWLKMIGGIMIKYKKYIIFALVLLVVFIGLSCAPGNYRWDPNVQGSKPANFWAGLWHGIIVVITFIVSLFNKRVGIYEVNNYGWPYNLGFILGLSLSIGGGFRFTRKKK